MLIYTQVFNASLGQNQIVGTETEVQYRSAVDSIAELPTSDNVAGDLRMVLDTDHLYAYVGGVWADQGVIDIGDLLQERLMQGLS